MSEATSTPDRTGRATRLHLTLYIAGAATVRSMSAKRRLDSLVQELDAEVHVDVVDVLESPELAERAGVFATPTLVRDLPPPGHRVIGDLAQPEVVMTALGLDPVRRTGLRSSMTTADEDR